MLLGLPEPQPDYDTAPFWDALAERRFVYQRCNSCGHTRWPPGPMCPECQSEDAAWEDASGTGTVYSWIIVTHPTHPAVVDQVPYTVLLVDLDDGPRVIGNFVDGDPSELEDGTPVRIVFEADGVVRPNFAPVD